jgi:hypothetical protein
MDGLLKGANKQPHSIEMEAGQGVTTGQLTCIQQAMGWNSNCFIEGYDRAQSR